MEANATGTKRAIDRKDIATNHGPGIGKVARNGDRPPPRTCALPTGGRSATDECRSAPSPPALSPDCAGDGNMIIACLIKLET